jgi:hypothetical protein
MFQAGEFPGVDGDRGLVLVGLVVTGIAEQALVNIDDYRPVV